MGKKKAKNKRKSELRIIFFIILVAAALFIISTYAWFSTQRNVSINNLSGLVEVAEGLEISLNGKTWANELVLGSGEGEFNITDSSDDYGPYPGHRNVSPKEMLPVSTLGILKDTRQIDLTMIRGKITNSIQLSDIVAMDETLALAMDPEEHNSENVKYPGYFAFDVFLKNSSKQYDKDDILQLNYDSSLKISADGNDTVGLQNTVRVALAKYGTGAVTSGTGNDVVRSGVADVMADQTTILQKTGAIESGDDVFISDVTIWEPNSNDHAQYIVDNNNRITWSAADASKYNKTISGGKVGFDVNTQMPTYALKESSLAEGTKINDIYFWDTTDTSTTDGDGAFSEHLQIQNTLQTTKTSTEDYTIKEGVQNLFSTTSPYGAEGDDVIPFSIAPNSVIRLRVYVWLEGQDIDCINYASHGGGITLNLGLVKGSDINSHGEPEDDQAQQ